MLGDLSICYLFLGGTGAGLCLALAIMGLLVPRASQMPESFNRIDSTGQVYHFLFGPCYGVAFAMLFCAAFCLWVDLGRPDQVFVLFLNPTLTFVSFGAWTLAFCIMLAALAGLWWVRVLPMPRRWLFVAAHVVLMVVAIAVMLYTGLLLQSIRAVPLWDSPLIPLLFVLSSSSCGIMSVLLIVQCSRAGMLFQSTCSKIVLIDACIVALEVLVLAMFFFSLPAPGAVLPTTETEVAALASTQLLIEGPIAMVFWGLLVVVGLLVPLVLDASSIGHASKSLRLPRTMYQVIPVVSSLTVLVGGYALRWCIVEAGISSSMILG